MTAVIYARYSSDNQREESIEGQIRECTAYAEKNGLAQARWRGLAPTSDFLCKGKQAVQTLRRKAPDSGKCANGVQKVCSRFPT